MENVVIKGTAENIYSPNFSMAGKTGTAKKYLPKHKDENGNTVAAGYSNNHYVASFAGFFPADNPKYSCIVVVHNPDKKKGYYGATVAAPVFKEIALNIFNTTAQRVVVPNQNLATDEFAFDKLEQTLVDQIIPNVKGMQAMDALMLLERLGLKVQLKGKGKVIRQSIKQGSKVKSKQQILLELS
jgi:cell division protein FtsI (penicillin-binding protein 3)